ncbi:MAG: cation-transporting P-type ATPase [Methanobacteriaceae archaeon]|jgi:Ca2+-transporting ATPase|nr:cation-transporting P-type ATPase [Candidatus Methanorudis spinitermitis]
MTNTNKILEKYKTSLNGLSQNEANKRLEKYGKNELREEKKNHPIKLFLMQFVEILIILLLLAAVAAYIIGDTIDAVVILFVVILNALIGFIQEYRAGKAMEKLKSLVSTNAIVKREREAQNILGTDLTLGDIVIIEEGDKVPADLMLIESSELRIDESSLTGESKPVTKACGISEEYDLESFNKDSHDEKVREKIAYMDSNVISGRGIGVVIAIGMDSSIGKIAKMIQEVEVKTPLQEKIVNLGKTLGLIAVIICTGVFLLQYFQGTPLVETFMIAVSLAVAAVPEGLPAILTLTLALGMQKMAKTNAVVRKLLAVETLGSCTVVCTDKTGTLTLNKMTVRATKINSKDRALEICSLCNNSTIKDGKVIGDPTDGAIMQYAEENNYKKLDMEKKYPIIKEIPLDSTRKRMTTIHKAITNNNDNDNKAKDKHKITENENSKTKEIYAFSKGAPEIILDSCKYIDNSGDIEIINNNIKEKIVKNIGEMTNSTLRVLGLAYKKIDGEDQIESPEKLEKDLIFAGLVGMMDPPREEAKKAIESCEAAGIKVVMITGDHQDTAAAIGKEIGILNTGKVLTGAELDNLNDDEFKALVEDVQVYARVYPEQKVRIVEALQNQDNVVSMTGDGVNDAPALKKASIGVAMGSGTDVSKESADMIIQDDNFATIIKAIREGRKIFDNIKRFVKFQVSTNVGAILTIISASVLSLPIPFNPIQILWINIIMDGPPAQSLGVEGAEKNIMNRTPGKGNILNKNSLSRIVIAGIVMAVGTLAIYFYELTIGAPKGLSPEDIKIKAMTVAFTTFVMFQIFNAFNCRAKSDEKNNFFFIGIIASFLLQLFVIYLPYLQMIFRTTAIDIFDWILLVLVAATILVSEKVVNNVMS